VTRPILSVLVVVALGAIATGCYAKSTGYQGQLTFAYASGLEFENFVKPIAPGAKLDVVAFANGTEDKLVITSATSSRPGVLTVEKINERNLVLKAGEPGVADLEITARDAAGNTLVDKMFFHVAKPAVHALEHRCTDSREAIYVKGERVDISHHLATSDGRTVIGYGYAPLRIEPESALELVPQPQGFSAYVFRARTTSPRVSIRSTVDDTAVTLRIIERGELKDASLDDGGAGRMLEGDSQYVVASVRLGDTPVCSQNALTRARSLTPEICAVTAKLEDDDGDGDANRHQLAQVDAIKFGVCKYELTLPELDGGRGVRLAGEAKVGRVQFPGDRAGGERVSPRPRGVGEHARSLLAEHGGMVRSTAYGWLLFGIGWTAPNAIVLACIGWTLRRRLAALAASRFARVRSRRPHR
jgi:hypothetical protein